MTWRAPWVVVALLGGFALCLAIAVAWPDDSLDVEISLALQRVPALDGILRAASSFGRAPVDIALPVIAIAAVAAVGAWLDAGCLAASVLGATALDHGVKWLVARPRPHAPVEVLQSASNWSFPSGHVTEYVALFGCLAIIAGVRVRSRVRRIGAIAFAVALIVLVGPSRIYLGVHWTSDVLGGYTLAGAWLWLVARVYVGRAQRTSPTT